MAGKAFESGQSLSAQILAKLPEGLRAKAAEVFQSPDAADALTELGARALAQGDYSRVMDELRDKEALLVADHEKLQGWYTTNEGKLRGYDALQAEVTRLKGSTTTTEPVTAPAGWAKEDAEKFVLGTVNERERAAAGYLNAITKLGLQHLSKFGEVLDPDALVSFCEQKKISIFDGYNAMFSDKLAAKAKEADDARINAIVEEKVKERMRTGADPRFPSRLSAEPSVLDALATKDGAAQFTVESAAALYDELTAAR